MRRFMVVVICFFALSACGPPTIYDVSHYRKDPDKRTVTIDGLPITVVHQQFGDYVAWGGEAARDGRFIKYRQRRAIEIYSKCRIDKVLSTPKQNVLYASVKC